MKFKLFSFLALFAVSAMLHAQEIGKVAFQQTGDFIFSEDMLKNNVQTKKGLMFSDKILSDDVRRLYAMGVFADVVSVVEDMPDGKKAVMFKVIPKQVVSEIVLEGNKKFSNKELNSFISVAAGQPLRDTELAATVEKLREFYEEKGYRDAKIYAEQKQTGGGIRVILKIEENLRIRIHNVTFENATVYPEKEMREALESRYSFLSAGWLSWLPLQGGTGLLNREALERDKVRLRELYWRKGYLDFKVKDIRIQSLPDDPELADVTFIIEEGEPYFVGEVTVEGNSKFTEDELLPLCSMKQDDVYSCVEDDRFVSAVEKKYHPLGYADFRMQAKKVPNFETHTVDLHYRMYEGEPYKIGEVYISGNKWTKDKVIRRELLLTPEDPLDQAKIEVSKSRLMGMGYFEGNARTREPGVEIVAVKSPEPGRKDIHVNVQEKRFIDGRIGAGWSSDDGLAGMLELTHTNMDILDPMHYFTGGGQRFRAMAIAGVEHMGLELDFTEPWLFDIPLKFDLSGYWREVTYDDWDERRIGFDVSLSKRIFDDFTTVSAGYTFEQIRVYDMDHDLSYRFREQRGSERAGRLHFQLERDTRDNIFDPASGYYVSGLFSLTSRGLGATYDAYKFELKGINHFKFFHDWFVLSTGFKVGTISTFRKNDDVPLFDRYFLGGGDSVRGFPFRSIGPVDGNEDNYGGQFMYVLTAELSHPIWPDYGLRGAVFADVGDATSGSMGPINKPNVGIGYGLRIKLPHVPLPIRLDLAYPVVKNQEGVKRKLRFHFSMGFTL